MDQNKQQYTDKVICICPTYNRKLFLPSLIYQFVYQTYPKELLELVILDDSDKPNYDIINSLHKDIRSRIHYMYSSEKNTIGKKRNMLNDIATRLGAKYIACVDDDDYYPKDRIEYSVKALKSSNYLICGSSILNIYDISTKNIHTLGPYINAVYPGHASCGTLMYDVKYLENNSFKDDACMAEESYFLNHFKCNLKQIPISHIMLCISHKSNTVSKNKLLTNANKTNLVIKDIIIDKFLLNFYSSL